MSWSSRLPSFGGRWSPFSSTDRPTPSQPIQVQESDYSYINPDDLDPPTSTTSSYAPKPSATPTTHSGPRPPRDTDVLVFRHGKSRFPVHFPAYGVSDGQVSVGDARAQAARKLDVADPKRVRMFFKGRNLKEDRVACRAEGMSSDVEAEILCVVGNESVPPAGQATGGQDDNDSDSGSDGGAGLDAAGDDDGNGGTIPKRKRNRSKKKKGKKHNPSANTPTPSSGTSTPTIPSTPLTPLAKLDAIASVFHTTLLPQCVSFTTQTPTDPAKKSFDHKRITETILGQVLLKLDAVEVEGDAEARGRRKEVVREVQGWLNRLDEVVKG